MRGILLGLCAAVATSAPVRAQSHGPAAGPPADSVIARYLAARGGAARVRGVRAERMAGRMTFASGLSGVDTVELARPLRIRTTIHFGDRVLVQGYDGRTAWTINPFAGDTAAHALDPGTAKNVIAGADMDGPLVDHAARGIGVALAGLDTADGRPAWALRVTRPDSTTDTYFVDTASNLVTKWQGNRTMDDTPVVFETWFRDYRRVDGLMFPFRLVSDTRGRPGTQRMDFDTVQVNAPIPDARFRIQAPGGP
jgi:hypothetical protein